MSANILEHAPAKTSGASLSHTPAKSLVSTPIVLPRPVMTTRDLPVPLWKRALDCTCIVLATPVVLPAMLLIGLSIRLSSKGPAIFKQERVGHLGRRFVIYKFRTMVASSDQDIHRRHMEQLIGSGKPMTKMDQYGDSRLVPMGRLLRATGLDELPQLINVLRGEMSLVGPRPCLPFEYERFATWQRERFDTLPGLTGLWQVSGKNRTTFNEMIQLDIRYARNASLLLDFEILMKTAPALAGWTQKIRTRTRGVDVPAEGERPLNTAQAS